MRMELIPFPLRQEFSQGTRVHIAAACRGWRDESVGLICGQAEPVQTAQGDNFFYWVKFDAPQFTMDSDGPYEKAQILSRCLRATA
jgi:hypothetical protein